MIMRARLIYERFSEDSDPIKDMGIGLPTDGDILKTIDQVNLAEKTNYDIIADSVNSDTFITINSVWFVLKVFPKRKYLILKLKGMQDLKHAEIYSRTKKSREHGYPDWQPFNLKLSYEQLTHYFKVVNK